jgi:RNA polymerase sigma factor (sigma-70 family)
MSSDETLALRAAQGDQHAFEQIYSRYHQTLYRFCLAMVGNPQDAQDALQNTMVKVLRALPGEKREIRLKPWLYRIARNESIETLRRRHDSEELEPQQAAGTEVTEVAETRERLRTLLEDLKQLPDRQRATLVMRELSGLDFDQIGASFGTSPAVARQTLYEARLSLRQLEAGREMRCAEVMRELSNADGRVTRRREIRAHLRSCADCRAFKSAIDERHEDLAALAPLPLAASAGLLHGVLGGKAGGAAGSAVAGGSGIATAGAGAGKAVATSALVKSAATVAVAAVVGVSAADRGGLIDLPLTGKGGQASPHNAAGHGSPAGESGGEPAGAGGNSNSKRQARGNGGGRGKREANDDSEGSNRHGAAGPTGNRSRSQSGSSPPGGGYGRAASNRHGPPDQPPDAAARGQGTANSHKTGHAASAPPGGGAKGENGNSSGGNGPDSKPTPPAKTPNSPPAASQPPAQVPPQANGDPGEQGQGGNPHGSEG